MRRWIVALGSLLPACGPGQAGNEGATACEQFELLPPDPFSSWSRDLDGDGHVDFVQAAKNDGLFSEDVDGLTHLTIAWGDGALNLETHPSLTFAGFPDPSNASIELADLDGDGLVDVVFTAATEVYEGPIELSFQVARQTAPRQFAAPVEATPAGIEAWAWLAAADLDGDGDDELIASGRLPGDDQEWLYTIETEAGMLGSIIPGFEGSWSAIEAADLDGDGRDEVVILRDGWDAGDPSVLLVAEAEPDGALVELATHEAGPGTGYTPADMQIVDFDGDGALDVFVENLDAIGLFRGHGDGTLSAAGRLAIPGIDEAAASCDYVCPLIRHAKAGDFDHDGVAELLIVIGTITAGSPMHGVWLVDGVLTDEPKFIAYDLLTDDVRGVVVGDLDEDGCDDVLYRREPWDPEAQWLLRRCPLGDCD